MRKLKILLILCLLSFTASAVKYFPSSITAPYAGAAQTVCVGSSNTATTVTYAVCGTTATGAALSVTPKWYLNGALVATGAAFNAVTGGGTITLAAGAFPYSTAGVFTGTNGLECILSWTTAAPGACTASLTVTGAATNVTVTATPAAITGPTSVCTGSSIGLTDATAGGTWSSSTGAVATVVLATGVVYGVTVGNTTISYKIGGCTVTSPVAVHATPTAISGASAMCAGATTTLSDPITGGTWTSGTTSIATVVAATGVVTGVAAGPGGIVTITYSTGCGTAATGTLNVTPIPTTITGLSSVCSGSSITLSNGAAPGTWSSGNSSVATITGGVVSGVTQGTATITYLTGCGTNATLVVTVLDVPGPISGLASVCAGSNITLSDDTHGGTWTSTNTPVATVNANTGLVHGVTVGSTTIDYSTGCGSIATFTVSSTTLPVTPVAIAGNTNICALPTALSDAVPGGVWSSNNTSVATVDVSGVVTGLAVGSTAIISYTTNNGCGSAFATVSVTVSPLPAPAAIMGSTSVCVGGITSLNDAALGGVWSTSNTSLATIDASGNVSGVGVGPSTISYTITNSCGVGFTVLSMAVVTSGPPAPAAITGPAAVCTGSHIALLDATAGGAWSSSAPGVATVNSSGAVYGAASGSSVISYTVSNSCASASKTATVTVNQVPNAGTITGSSTVCLRGTTTLVDASPGGGWSSANTAILSVNGSGVVTGVGSGSTVISYTVTNSCGSVSTFTTLSVVNYGDCINQVGAVNNADEITVYPNPAYNELFIKATNKINTVSITNLVGQAIFSHEYDDDQVTVDLSNIVPGVYLIKINGTMTRKFIKQ